MNFNSTLKDRNYESPDSTLKIKYIANYGKNRNDKTIQINPFFYKINPNNPKIRYKINDLRKEQFNSYSNENMDFFRLDHLCECDRDNYHNRFMDNIKPLNRSANFYKLNELAQNIKYLDYLKQNYLLNQNKKINSNIYSEKDIEITKRREKYYNRPEDFEKRETEFNRYNNDVNNSYDLFQNNRNNFNTFNKEIDPYKRELTKSNSTLCLTGKCYNKNINYEKDNNENMNRKKNYSNLYLSNINNYSIKEGDKNFFEDTTKLKLYPTFQREPLYNEKMKRLYNQDNYKNLINNNPFYIAYNENSKNGGFLKRNGDFLNNEKLYKNKFFFRNDKSDLYENKGNNKIYNFNSNFQMNNNPYYKKYDY